MDMTDPISDAQAEKLLPCKRDKLFCQCQPFEGGAHSANCPAYYRPAVSAALSELREQFRQHTATVSKFLGEMLAVYDPCANADEIIPVKDACTTLLRNALTDRQTIADLSELRAEIERLRNALSDIAGQPLMREMLEPDNADFEGGYETCVQTARAALSDKKEQR